MKLIVNEKFSNERALYGLDGYRLDNVKFDGEEDGESALKECSNIEIFNSAFHLRYPLWHDDTFLLDNCYFATTSRAPIWYSNNGTILNTKLEGPKAVRECIGITIKQSSIISNEFAWMSKDIFISDSTLESEYLLLNSKNIKFDHVNFKGKYSFQYVENVTISSSNLDTKDAFWHAKNVYVKDSVVKGEYLGWYSDGLTFENCTITGTQPLCYCKNLKIINCKMIDTDLSFEYSDVDVSVIGDIESIKNVRSGKIICDNVKEVINEDDKYNGHYELIRRNK